MWATCSRAPWLTWLRRHFWMVSRAMPQMCECPRLFTQVVFNRIVRTWSALCTFFLRYAFGITLWELYTGGHPFKGIAQAVLGHQVRVEERIKTTGSQQKTAFWSLCYRILWR
jgi:hypothetical protein